MGHPLRPNMNCYSNMVGLTRSSLLVYRAVGYIVQLNPFDMSTYSINSGNQKIKVANCSLASVVGQWTITLTLSVSLISVNYVSKFLVNLPLIHEVIKDLNCEVSFFPSHYVSWTLIWGGWLIMLRNKRGSAILMLEVTNGCIPLFHVSKFSSNKVKIWLHPISLWYPSFPLLKTMFTLLIGC